MKPRWFASVLLFAIVAMSAVVRPAEGTPVKAAVFRSTGTLYLGQTIWR
jgi:hypothetical protein